MSRARGRATLLGRNTLLVLTIALAVGAAYFALRFAQQPSPTVLSRQQDPTGVLRVASPEPARVAQAARANAPKPLAPLAQAFAEATNYKRFVDERGADPAGASFLFAAEALEICSAVLAETQTRQAMASRLAPTTDKRLSEAGASVEGSVRARALQALERLCAGIPIGPELSFVSVPAEGASAGDRFYSVAGPEPTAVLRAAKSQPKNVEGLVGLTRDTSDPYVLSEALEILSLPPLASKVVVFGEPVSRLLPEQQAALFAAFRLLKCDFGANCGPNSPEVLYSCAVPARAKRRRSPK